MFLRLFIDDFDSCEECWEVFCNLSLTWDLSAVFLMVSLECVFGEVNH